ncbi:glycosyltransferase [uncultured Bacteroides sp.]|jgi:glycosyltransferase involved in cell wall biosynthesis|uniref:glycosyltransferase n=1 Tax=uncultured Bacteroides sp. TaxID=162156 RepID=UPI00258432D3|nr:glycosyltransferase [uncultured Bacteroides sp.]
MDVNELTIIIPFRNEKESVYKTLTKLDEYYGKRYSIILINDASDDGYDYEKDILNFDHILYIKNESLLGTGGSRDKGALLAKSQFLLFLDAHCSLPNNALPSLLQYASAYPKSLICLQSRIMIYGHDKELYLQASPCENRAGYIDFNLLRGPLCLRWEYMRPEEENAEILEVPCIRGGAYCIEREYYLYLHGYNGLICHGCENAFISTKVWLEGGRCLLLPKQEVNHLYRWSTPYNSNKIAEGYNKIIYTCLLMQEHGEEMKETINLHFCESSRKIINKYLQIVYKEIEQEKEYLSSIFKHKFMDIIKLNRNNGNRIYPQ